MQLDGSRCNRYGPLRASTPRITLTTGGAPETALEQSSHARYTFRTKRDFVGASAANVLPWRASSPGRVGEKLTGGTWDVCLRLLSRIGSWRRCVSGHVRASQATARTSVPEVMPWCDGGIDMFASFHVDPFVVWRLWLIDSREFKL